MSDTTYVDYIAPAVNAEWLNEINDHVWHDTPVMGTTVHNANTIKVVPFDDILSTDTQSALEEINTYLPAGTGAVTTTVQNKLRETVSVKDFGAACDGTTDDSTALFNANAAAVAKNVPITIPAKMHIPSPVTITAGLLEDYATLFSSTSLVTVDGGGDKLAPTINLNTMGLGGSAAQNKSALQFALDNGGAYTFEPGGYTFDTGVTSSYASQYSLGSFDTKRYDINGMSRNNTVIYYSGTGYWLTATGGAEGHALQAFDRLSNFSLQSNAVGTNYGISYALKVCPEISNVYIAGFKDALRLDGVFSAKIDNLKIAACENGLVMDGISGLGSPNLIKISKSNFEGCTTTGINGQKVGDNIVLDSIDVESCGTAGNAATGGVYLSLDASNGPGPLTIKDSYFELNRGGFDIYINNAQNLNATAIIDGCFFNRASAAAHTINNIVLRNTGTGTLRVIVRGCAFHHTGDYTPSAGETYFNIGTNCELIDGGANTYSSAIPLPNASSSRPGITSEIYVGDVNADGSSNFLPKGVSVTKGGAGTYTVTNSIGWGIDVNAYFPNANSASGVNNRIVHRVLKVSVSDFVVYTTDVAATPTDAPFYFQVARIC